MAETLDHSLLVSFTAALDLSGSWYIAARQDCSGYGVGYVQGRCKATWRRKYKLQWREAGPSDHHNDKVDLEQSRTLSVGMPD